MAEVTRISEDRSIIIPAELLRALSLHAGGRLLIEITGNELRIYTPAHAIRRAQQLLSPYLKGKPFLADELIAERRAEAEHGS
jgi:bifunctional DNA-binding transcriptional regulator/antitoxin component of YhaV-PrlF toxin-antitoxin module